MATKNEKEKALETTIASLEKQFGKGTIMQMGKTPIEKIGAISTGCMSIDEITGIGGIPRGRVTEIYGPESSGKTTLCLHIIAQAQKAGGMAAFIDAEHALDLNYANNIGVDSRNLLISQPDWGEQALEVADALICSNSVDIVVVDSVAALVPRSELEGEMGDASVALQARLMSRALRKLTSNVNKSNTTLIFINQLRSKIGVMFGNPETTTGGNALKFYASMRIDIRKQSALKVGDKAVGNVTKVKIVKSKVSPPFRETVVNIISPYGIDIVGDVFDKAVDFNIIKKGGAWFTYKEDRWQGRESVLDLLKKDPIFFEQIKTEVLTAIQKGVEKVPEVLPQLV